MIDQNSETETQFIASLQAVNQRLIQEIQERKRVEEAWRESSERLKTLINAMPDLVCFKDGSGRWLEANQAILELFQLKTLDYQGKSDPELAELVEQVYGQTLYRNVLINCQQSDQEAWENKKLSQQQEIIPDFEGNLRIFDVIKVPLFHLNGERKGLVILGRDITEHQQAENAYKQLAAIVESSEDGIIGKTLEGEIISWNQGAQQIYGYSEAEVKDCPFSLLTLPERLSEVPQILASIQSGGSIDHYETVHIRKDRQHIDVCLTISPMKDDHGNITGISTISRDISYQKRIEKTLEQLRHQNELILDSAGEGICGLNREGKITFANPAAARMTGYTIRELLMSDWQKITQEVIAVSPDNTHSIITIDSGYQLSTNQQNSQIFATLEDGLIRHVDNEVFWHRNGSYFPVEYVSTPIENQGEIIGAVVTFKDITERQAMEKMKDEFISVVSHELRTPLTSIHGALGLLASGLLDTQPQRAKRMLEIAITNTTRLVRLINDILDLERMQAGQITLDKKSCNLADLMVQANNEMIGMAEKAGVNLSIKPLGIHVWVAPDRIIQLLTNLLSNAIRFSSVDSCVCLDAKLHNSGLSLSSLEVLITVQDQGQGIPADKLETIFGRFQQVDASDSRQKGGTGLGLAICRSIVQQHGGHIWAESKLGKGSTFFVRLPVAG
ncbi:MAG TPA: PAS domain-containing sensor histidine kinase [Planktothrix sp. UBA8407]|jgi:PAS domain S-box|nr:PAS domain-containing sensor histidine kinase [Planktothrix sp. UBA8402]HAO12345.1 PAS domain-containing sensor histidine kinase [Planktothrix sp. UBA8407]HBK24298.1 PAS domain-containing sensor histidine kinase [Planktothrix sp. UBA10369]